MRFRELAIRGAYLLEVDRAADERGAFARTFCSHDFALHGLDARVAQMSLSSNRRARTLRGMHYTDAASGEAKTVRCVKGAAVDVIVDVRRESPSFGHWVARPLSAENACALYIPAGVAHGFLTLEDETDVLYAMSVPYDPSAGRGFRYDDPTFAIEWPSEPLVIAERDARYPRFA